MGRSATSGFQPLDVEWVHTVDDSSLSRGSDFSRPIVACKVTGASQGPRQDRAVGDPASRHSKGSPRQWGMLSRRALRAEDRRAPDDAGAVGRFAVRLTTAFQVQTSYNHVDDTALYL